MPGKPGKSGGQRPGAGRPTKRVSLALGQRYYLTEQTPDGATPGRLATVEFISRNQVVLALDDGAKITLTK